MTELRKLYLYGSLAQTYGAEHEVAADSLPAALRIADCNYPGLLNRIQRGQFHCLHGGADIEEATELHEHQVTLPRARGDFHLVPVAEGAKGRSGKIIFQIVVGGALLATGVGGALGAFGTAASQAGVTGFAASTGFLGLTYGTTALMGAALFLGGISQLLTPVPKVGSDERDPTAFTFGGPAQVNTEGGAVPLAYGEVIWSGITVAASIKNGYGGSYGGYGYPDSGYGYGGGSSSYGFHRVSLF